MASTRERARVAMATMDRCNPNLDDVVGLNWSCWIDMANVLSDEGGSKVEEPICGRKRTETMTLCKEDMKIYGYCPALDNFYLVVCSHCGQVVKPQAFENHCERHHGPLTKLCNQSSCLAPQQRPRSSRPQSILSPRERQKADGSQEAGDSSKPIAASKHVTVKVQKGEASLSSVKTFHQEVPSSPTLHSTPCPRLPSWDQGPLTSGGLSSSHSSVLPSEKRKPADGHPGDQQSPPRGPRTYNRTYKKVYMEECDLDKHCGVLDPARKKLCARQLTCNMHSIQLRRQVVCRSKTLDQLVMEHRTGSLGSGLGKLAARGDSQTCLEAPQDSTANQHDKRNLCSNFPILWMCVRDVCTGVYCGCNLAPLRVPTCKLLCCVALPFPSGGPEESDSGPEEDGQRSVEVQPPYPFNQSLPSSEESEDEEKREEEEEEEDDIPATPSHPKPLGMCTFGSHTLGSSVFTFDRRLHHLRLALSDMVEHHVNAHPWTTIPQASSGLRSRNTATTAQVSAVKSRASPTGSSSLGSASSGQPKAKSNQQSLTSGQPASAAGLGAHPAGITPGRPSKAQQRGQELAAAAAAAPPHGVMLARSGRAESDELIGNLPIWEKGKQRQAPARLPHSAFSSHGPTDGHFSLGKKPCRGGSFPPGDGGMHATFNVPRHPPPQSSARDRGRQLGAQGKAASLDSRGPAQKRKAGSAEAVLSPSPPKTCFRSRCSSSQSRPSLFSWKKGGSVGGVLARALGSSMSP